MSDPIIVAMIAAVGTAINSLLGIAILFIQGKTHRTFNSKMDLALQAQRALGDAEGRLSEKRAEHMRQCEAAMTKSQVDETTLK